MINQKRHVIFKIKLAVQRVPQPSLAFPRYSGYILTVTLIQAGDKEHAQRYFPADQPQELLKTLAEMGHGDEIILSDAHFPAHSMGIPVLRADGIRVAPLLDAILPLFELDAYVDAPVVMMAAVPGDTLDQSLLDGYRAAIEKHAPDAPATAISTASTSTNAPGRHSRSWSPARPANTATSC